MGHKPAPPMPHKVLESVARIVDYLHDDDERHYREADNAATSQHIFGGVREVRNSLEAIHAREKKT